jgi:hypothetical protein
MTRSVGFYDKETRTVRWVPLEVLKDAAAERRKNPIVPQVVFDSIKPERSNADGRVYTSRAERDAAVARSGFITREEPINFTTDCTNKPLDEVAHQKDVNADFDEVRNAWRWGNQKLSEQGHLRAKLINEVYEGATGKPATIFKEK